MAWLTSCFRSFDNGLKGADIANMALRRLGPSPHKGGAKTPSLQGCPDVFELENGDFVVVGQDKTTEIISQLPKDATCGPDERIVVIPRKTLVLAKPQIPDRL